MQNFNNNFNNPYGNPYGYNNPYNNAGNYQQPKLNQYAFVNGIEGAKAYQVQPNQTMMLMDSDEPIVYKKTANGYGQATIQAFKLVPMDEPTNQNKAADYVLRADFDALSKKFDDLSAKFEKGLKKEIKEE